MRILLFGDSALEVTISQSILHHGLDYTPFEGLDVKGWPVCIILRGNNVILEGDVVGLKGFGC